MRAALRVLPLPAFTDQMGVTQLTFGGDSNSR